MSKFVIEGRLAGLNEYTSANRSNKYGGSKMKENNENHVIWAIRQAKLSKVDKYPIKLKITWYELNLKRDIDNIIFATKFIQDALVKSKIIKNDSQKYINKIEHEVILDRKNARIEVEIIES